MRTLIRDRIALEKLIQLPFSEKFSRFDEEGKTRYLSTVFGAYYNQEEPNLTDEEREFAEGLKKAVGTSGIGAALAVVEGSGTQTWQRGCTVCNVIEEADRILNDENYRRQTKTVLSDPYWLKTIREQTKD